MSLLYAAFIIFRAFIRNRCALVAENLALRQQLAILQWISKRPKLRVRDRIFWVWLSKLWSDWQSVLVIVQSDTVVKWHRQGFRLYWRWKSRRTKTGRPKINSEIRKLIKQVSSENPTWGVPRIKSELLLLGYSVAESTIARYMTRTRKPPSQTWRTFLNNHITDIVAVDFFTVPTATFRIFYCFLILSHDRRRVIHFNITAHPTAQWTTQQIIEAFPYDEAPRYLLRDRDSIYGDYFRQRIKSMGIEEVVTAPYSPWQNPYVERFIGSVRRECLNHVIILNESHLRRILADYFDYYNKTRPHLSVERNAPIARQIEPPEQGNVIAIPQVGGLHNRYTRVKQAA